MKKLLLLGVLLPNVAFAEEFIIIASVKKPIPAQKIVSISAEKLEDRQIVLVQDAFKYVSAMNFSRAGGIGTPTNVRIRGAEGDKTLVIIDGQKTIDPSLPTGGFDFGQLMLGDVQQIEVMKGIGSSLYGSDAIGGVVSIITKRPDAKNQINIDFQTGTEATTNAKLFYGNVFENHALALYGSHFETAGISQFSKKRGGREKDGFQQKLLGAKAWFVLGQKTELFLKAEQSVSKLDFDGYPAPFYNFADTLEYGESKNLSYFAKLNAQITDNFTHSLSLSQVRSKRQNFDPTNTPQINFDSLGTIQSLDYLAQFNLQKLILIGGFGLEKNEYEISYPSPWDPQPSVLKADATTKAVFGELQYEPIQNLKLKLGIRNDNHDTFGGQTSFHGNIAYRADDFDIHAAISEGFKAPSLYQLYSDYGNTDLNPEIADGYEFGIAKHFGLGKFSATYFARKAKNQIDFFSCYGASNPKCTTRPFGFYDNLAKTKTNGWEFDYSAKIKDFSIDLGGAIIEAKNEDANSFDFNNQLPRQPKFTAFAALGYKIGNGFKIGLNGNYVSKRRENIYSNFNLAAYDLWDLTFSKELNSHLEIYGHAENIFDKEYESVKNYGTNGAGIRIGFRVKY